MGRLTFSTRITLVRIVLVPLLVALILADGDVRHAPALAAVVFLLASFTDFVDGYLARRWQQVTSLGNFLDTTAGMLLSRLVRQGREVRALVRRPGDRERLPTPEVELALGDLENEEALVRAAEGCEVVYAAAGMNQLCLPDPTPLYRVNVDGTARLLRAAQRAGVRRVVYTSSAATLGGDGSRAADEGSPPPETFTSHYARSKYQAERVALEFLGVEVVTLNPSSVQGPGRTTGTARVFLDYLNGRLRFDLPSRFGICYTEWIAQTRGQRPLLCREAVRTVGHPHVYDGTRAERELGLRYTPLREAMEATVRWYLEQGLVSRRLPRLDGEPPGAGGGSRPRHEGGTAA